MKCYVYVGKRLEVEIDDAYCELRKKKILEKIVKQTSIPLWKDDVDDANEQIISVYSPDYKDEIIFEV